MLLNFVVFALGGSGLAAIVVGIAFAGAELARFIKEPVPTDTKARLLAADTPADIIKAIAELAKAIQGLARSLQFFFVGAMLLVIAAGTQVADTVAK